ncbi:MAG: HAD family hydrolase [Kiritimatiellia bacterium]
MKIRAVFFDLDGTLLNTLEDLADSANAALQKHGLPVHPVDAYRHFVGSGAITLITRAMPPGKRSDEIIEACYRDFRMEYDRRWDQKTQPYAGIPELLNELQARGIRMAVLSNKPQAAAELCVKRFLAQWPFDPVRGEQPGIPVKPDPAGALAMAARLGLRPEEVLYLGDSDVDMHTAVRAGFLPAGALWGFRTEKELIEAGARAVLSRPADLLPLLA